MVGWEAAGLKVVCPHLELSYDISVVMLNGSQKEVSGQLSFGAGVLWRRSILKYDGANILLHCPTQSVGNLSLQ